MGFHDYVLMYVISTNAIKIAKYLLESKKSSNTLDSNYSNSNCKLVFDNIDVSSRLGNIMAGNTPLTLAVEQDHVDIVSLLINNPNMTKSGMNRRARYRFAPLHIACSHYKKTKEAALIFYLLINDQRTDVNALNGNQHTALMQIIPVSFKDDPPRLKLLQALIDNKRVDVNIQGCRGNTALHIACEFGDDKSVKALLTRSDLDCGIKNEEGKTARDVARSQVVIQLLDCHTSEQTLI